MYATRELVELIIRIVQPPLFQNIIQHWMFFLVRSHSFGADSTIGDGVLEKPCTPCVLQNARWRQPPAE